MTGRSDYFEAGPSEGYVVALANHCEGLDPDTLVQISVRNLRVGALAVNHLALKPLFDRMDAAKEPSDDR